MNYSTKCKQFKQFVKINILVGHRSVFGTYQLVYNAAASGINLESLDISLGGDLDLRGFLGISDEVRPVIKT